MTYYIRTNDRKGWGPLVTGPFNVRQAKMRGGVLNQTHLEVSDFLMITLLGSISTELKSPRDQIG